MRAALLEDLGRAGDITTDAIVPADARGRDGAGRAPGRRRRRASTRPRWPSAWSIRAIQVRIERPDGSRVEPGDVLAAVDGPARGMLTAERVALNLLGHLSRHRHRDGDARRGGPRPQGAHRLHAQDHARPARPAEVRGARRRRRQSPLRPRRRGADQGQPHRRRRRRRRRDRARARRASATWSRSRSRSTGWPSSTRRWPRGRRRAARQHGAATLAEAVRRIAGRAITEASGRITPATAPAIAATGVDLISIGWLTHSAAVLDIGLDWRHASTGSRTIGGVRMSIFFQGGGSHHDGCHLRGVAGRRP